MRDITKIEAPEIQMHARYRRSAQRKILFFILSSGQGKAGCVARRHSQP
jgi:hypothetical protein